MNAAAQTVASALVDWLRVMIMDMRFPPAAAALVVGVVLGRSQNVTLRAIGQALLVGLAVYVVALALQALLGGAS
jgi:hypothetical protein